MSLNTVKYRLYPTLLNAFDRFEKGYLTESELLDRVNRVPMPQTDAQLKGVSFENAVIKGIDEEMFDHALLANVRALLPRPMLKTQFYCEYQVDDVMLYGYVDVLGKLMAVDIKTTKKYVADCYTCSHQNLYLPALRTKGVRSLRYIITDFENVFVEEYDQNTDLTPQLSQIRTFCDFLDTHRTHITDRRIFAS